MGINNYMRKNFLLFFALLFLYLPSPGQPAAATPEWLFIYYMPYDNNLSFWEKEITAMLKTNISHTNVMAVIQADNAEQTGSTRYVINKDTVLRYQVATEYSASTKTYADYLAWVYRNFSFKKQAVVFLDHGGRLDELCLDEYPENKFLKVDSLRTVFEKQDKKIDLLFLQVCTKGSVEPLYEFRNVAGFTLCSQTELGAPNFYYEALFSGISSGKISSTRDVIKTITENDTYNMYNAYTCIDNSKWDSVYNLLKKFTERYPHKKNFTAPPGTLEISYFGEKYWDIVSFLIGLPVREAALAQLRTRLISAIKQELIILYKTNPNKEDMNKYCGLSIHAFDNKTAYPRLTLWKLIRTLQKTGR